MPHKVLVPYDGSEQSENALAYALGAFPDSEITVFHVVTSLAGHGAVDGYEEAIAAGRDVAEEAAESAPDDRGVDTDVVYGRPVQEILEHVEDGGFDHVVMGSHGRDGATRLLLGSVAETVVRRASVPVTVVRDGEAATTNPEQILVPFDGSDLSEAALEHALGQYPEADVTALYVVYPPRDVLDAQVDISSSLEAEDDGDHVSEALAAATEVGDGFGRAVNTASVEGLPEEQIVAVVEEEGFDHVVMGSTGREGFERLLLGSVAETVVRRSPVSVTVAVSEVET